MTPRKVETNVKFNKVRDTTHALIANPMPRFRWTRELHELFVEAVNQLGGAKDATPRHIRNLMDIQEVTLSRIKSHLQKYRMSQPENIQSHICHFPGVEAAYEVKAGNLENGTHSAFELHLNDHNTRDAHVSRAPNMKIDWQGRQERNLKLDNIWLQERGTYPITPRRVININDDPVEQAIEVTHKAPNSFQMMKGLDYLLLPLSSASCSNIDEKAQYNLKRDHWVTTEANYWSSSYKKSVHISNPHPSPCISGRMMRKEENVSQQNLDLSIGLPGASRIDSSSSSCLMDELKLNENNRRNTNLARFAVRKPEENIIHMQKFARDGQTSRAKNVAFTRKGFDLNVSAWGEEQTKGFKHW